MSPDLWRKELEVSLRKLPILKRMQFRALQKQFEGSGQPGLPWAVRLGRGVWERWKR